jgi:phosphoserine aminotransferase
MVRVHNFSAGPAAMPLEVLERAQSEFVDFNNTGMSLLEMSHRSPAYQAVIDSAEATLRRVLSIPDDYAVLFLQGGATLEFAGIPMNLMRTGRAGYVVSGHFAERAWDEAGKYGENVCLASSKDTNFDRIPDLSGVRYDGLDYAYICQNNTIFGTMFHEVPDTGATPLVADVSSCFLATPLDVPKYGMVYAGAQKNAGPAGVTVLIVRKDLVEDGPALSICPTYLDYRRQMRAGSMYNTPNTFGIYMCGLVFDWVERQGGVAEMRRRNQAKADLLYDALDASGVLHGTAEAGSRSICNVTFTTGVPDLDAEFIATCKAANITGIKGHRLVGGMRASIYNAVSYESCELLGSIIDEFSNTHAIER